MKQTTQNKSVWNNFYCIKRTEMIIESTATMFMKIEIEALINDDKLICLWYKQNWLQAQTTTRTHTHTHTDTDWLHHNSHTLEMWSPATIATATATAKSDHV